MPLNITIASYGPIGKACSTLLQQDGYLNDKDAYKNHQVTWMDLDAAEHEKTTEAGTADADADIVLIIGDNTSGDAASAAINIATRCAERNVPCYALLVVPTEKEDHDPLLMCLKSSASNTLLIRQGAMRADAMPTFLSAAVQNVLHPITGEGMIGVDYVDIRTILSCGKETLFTVAKASGEKRAEMAAHAAAEQLPELRASRGIICNITSGFDLTMNHFELIGNIVHEAIPEDATVICSTTLNTDWDEQIRVGITIVY